MTRRVNPNLLKRPKRKRRPKPPLKTNQLMLKSLKRPTRPRLMTRSKTKGRTIRLLMSTSPLSRSPSSPYPSPEKPTKAKSKIGPTTFLSRSKRRKPRSKKRRSPLNKPRNPLIRKRKSLLIVSSTLPNPPRVSVVEEVVDVVVEIVLLVTLEDPSPRVLVVVVVESLLQSQLLAKRTSLL